MGAREPGPARPLGPDTEQRGLASGLRDWLATRPASTTRHDYDDWAAEKNEHRPAGELPYVKSGTIVGQSALLWNDWLAIARGETSYEERAAERLEARRHASDRHDLISATDVALLLGMGETAVTVLAKRPGFPRAVARLGQARVWYRSDVETYRDGRTVPQRREDELQDELISIHEIVEWGWASAPPPSAPTSPRDATTSRRRHPAAPATTTTGTATRSRNGLGDCLAGDGVGLGAVAHPEVA
jgi:predicted DNA-binding transcriptional regulator AlpA